MAETNVVAEAVNTVQWLTTSVTRVAVPVYQRHYRWDVERCQRLVDDIRTVADAGEGRTHFIGSILATQSAPGGGDFTLVDGQQRIFTLTLLAAALCHQVQASDPATATQLQLMLIQPG